MKETLERELKLEAKGSLDLEQLGGQPIDDRVFSSTYYDTADRRLLRHGITARRRDENGARRWQVKLPRAEGRLELEDEDESEELAPALAAVLAGVLRQQRLEPVATMVTHRRGRRVDGVDVTHDEVEVVDGSSTVDVFSEIEAELVAGSPAALRRVGSHLRKLGARPTNGLPKLARVLGDVETAPRAQDGSNRRIRAFLLEQLTELERHDPAVRAGDDPEDVHEMRVAVRRLRSVLRSAKPLLDERWVTSLRSELDWVGRQLGDVRDLDVLSDDLHHEAATLNRGDAAAAATLLRPLSQERAEARARLIAMLNEPRYHRVLDDLAAAAASLPARREADAKKLARKEFQKLRKSGDLTSSMSSAALHKRRIRIKRARYAAELAEPDAGRKARSFIAAAKELQDVLGAHQDASVASRRLRDLSRGGSSRAAALVAGRLIERQERRMQEARAELPEAWKRLRRRGKRAWTG